MGSMNWNRVILGGIVAGLIIDAFEWAANGVLLGAQWRQAMEDLGSPMEESSSKMLFYILLGFAYGIMTIAAYAAIRPRFGAGPKTAIWAGVGVWLLGYCLPTLMWMPMGLFPKRLMVMAMLIGLVEIMVATLAGAWVYQEPTPGAEATARRAA